MGAKWVQSSRQAWQHSIEHTIAKSSLSPPSGSAQSGRLTAFRATIASGRSEDGTALAVLCLLNGRDPTPSAAARLRRRDLLGGLINDHEAA